MTPREREDAILSGCDYSVQKNLEGMIEDAITEAVNEAITVTDIHAIEKERDQWRRNYYDVADALAAKSESPAHLASIARDLRQQITRIERERDESRAELRDERQRFDSLDELACKAIRERDEARSRSDTFQGECARLIRERDEVTKWGQETVARTVNERDAARQQVAQRDNRVQELALQLIGIEKERDATQEQTAYWQRAAHEFEQESIRELAQRDQRIAEIEAALRRLCGSDDFRDCGMDAGMVYQRVEQIARAALSAPAQPATAAPTHTDLMVSPESLEECMCSKNGCPIHDNGPCSICAKPFSDCGCTFEQKTKAWRDWYAENGAVPPSPAAREAAKCRCGHDKDQHSTQGDGCLVNAFDGDDPPCKCMRFSPPPRDVNSSNRPTVCATCKQETVNYVYYYTVSDERVATCRACVLDTERALHKVVTAARAAYCVGGMHTPEWKQLRDALAAFDAWDKR